MARKKAKVNEADGDIRPRDFRGSTGVVNTAVKMPNEAEIEGIIKGLGGKLDPSPKQIERLLNRLVKAGKLRPEAVPGAKAIAVEVSDIIESRDEPLTIGQVKKVLNDRYIVGGSREAEGATETTLAKQARTSGLRESQRGIDPGPDKMKEGRVADLLSTALRGRESKSAVRKTLKAQEKAGVKVFSPKGSEEAEKVPKDRRPPTISERVAQLTRRNRRVPQAQAEGKPSAYRGKGSRGVPKIADTGGLQSRLYLPVEGQTEVEQFIRGPAPESARPIVSYREAPTARAALRYANKGRSPEAAERYLRAQQLLRKAKIAPREFKPGSEEALDPEMTKPQRLIGPMEEVRIPTRIRQKTVPVQGPLRRLPRRGPRTSTGKPIEYKFEDSGRPMGMSAKKYEEIRTVEGVPFDKTLYAKLDRLARKGNEGAARVLAKLKTKGFGARMGLQSGEVMNPETKKVRFKSARQKAYDRAKQEARALGKGPSDEVRKMVKGGGEEGESVQIRTKLGRILKEKPELLKKLKKIKSQLLLRPGLFDEADFTLSERRGDTTGADFKASDLVQGAPAKGPERVAMTEPYKGDIIKAIKTRLGQKFGRRASGTAQRTDQPEMRSPGGVLALRRLAGKFEAPTANPSPRTPRPPRRSVRTRLK